MGLMPKPITSRHGTKGGRFIDGMYTNKQGLQYVMGITFISDTGIFSDHDLVITKCDLGLQLFKLNNAKEERIDFRSILNIPITWKENATHPSIADSVFKGIQFQQHAALYNRLQQVCKKPEYRITTKIEQILQWLEDYEKILIHRTQTTIDIQEQCRGKLIRRTLQDAEFLNNVSKSFFEVVYDVCRHAELARMVNIIPLAAKKALKQSVISDKIMPGTGSLPFTKQVDDTLKRSKNCHQRVQIILRIITQIQRGYTQSEEYNKKVKSLTHAIQTFIHQQPRFTNSLAKTISMCEEIGNDRIAHIEAIENARNKKIYDVDKPLAQNTTY